jgi:hypothetical protein
MSWYSSLGLVSGERCVVKPGSHRSRHLVPYYQDIKLEGVTPPGFGELYLECFHGDGEKTAILGA